MVWAKIEIKGSRSLYISSFYNPTTSDDQSLECENRKIESGGETKISQIKMADLDWGASVDEQEQKLTAKVDNLKITKPTKPETVNGAGSAASGEPKSTPDPGGAAEGGPEDGGNTKEDESLLRKLIHSKLISSKANLEVLQKDPNSPLYSVKTFEALNLKKELLEGVYKMGFTAPSKIQETALPTLLADPPVNMIAQSQSGTGKTAAFVLTMLSRVDISKDYPQCLCLAPTYELALQIGQNVEQMGQKMTGLRISYAVRGERGCERITRFIDQIPKNFLGRLIKEPLWTAS
ncbi:ATP-dependent RNA helicase DDX19/DBP5 [Mytilus galloprovincialis]|uniref:RNA helicase n=1 Tax=Mytilus galloprovincialis TaxID=29158 RepID=A0A8B6G774_MYTGA|nr:ATP-dependent RNA helicase DDX19/DBP5 [Mytilus galloprovincialis]